MLKEESKIKQIVQKLVNELYPLKIILFGSHAWGNPTEDSDIDLLIITEETNVSRLKRVSRAYSALREFASVPVDILIRSAEEYNTTNNIKGSFFFEISKSGLILYERE